MDIQVIYDGGLNKELDKKIQTFFEGLGYEWTGQGMQTETQIRDITFKKLEEGK